MTLEELMRYFAIFDVSRNDLVPMFEVLDASSIEAMQEATDRLKKLKDKARKGFRKVAFPCHPDHSNNPSDHARFNTYNAAMTVIDDLTIGSLEAITALSMDGFAKRHGMETFMAGEADEAAQFESFMAMAKWYKGPMIPVGWTGNRETTSRPKKWQEPPSSVEQLEPEPIKRLPSDD